MAKTTMSGATKPPAAKARPSRGAAIEGDAPEPVAAGDDEAAGGASSYLVPGLERGLRILAEFSAREPVLGAPEL